jgi:glycerol-3-phosphate acyltransferase PlsX
MLPVAIDAMGGDHAPAQIVDGARQAQAAGIPVVLVGRRTGDRGLDTLGPDALSGLGLIECAEVIEMDEDPAKGVRTKKDSSLVRAAELVRDSRASAFMSAGNTGATMASALLRMGRIRGVQRPAIATPIPVPGAGPTVLLDAGANAECTGAMLVQFAQMGSVFARRRYGIDRPRVGLLSIGEEDGKGNPLAKEANELLRAGAAGPEVHFIGNVEGRDVMTDDVDVIVTDGFTGNVVLKTLEGGMKFLVGKIFEAFMSSDENKAAAKVLLPALGPIAEALDPNTYGGAMLLGVDGVCIISHGSSNASAVLNAAKVARDMVECDLVGALRSAIQPPE